VLFRPGEVQRPIKGRTHQADGEDPNDWCGAGEAGFNQRLAPAAQPDQVICRRAYVVQPKLRLQMRAVANGINRAVEYDAFRRAVDSDY
jgi:hypothetical protein